MFFKKALYAAVVVVGTYPVILTLLCIPTLQRELLFLNRIKFPFFVNYDRPEDLGLARGLRFGAKLKRTAFKVRNLYLSTSDGEKLGAWHVLPRTVYRQRHVGFDQAFSQRPTIIYLHGNAGTRATGYRVRTYSAMSSVLDCNVLAIDYRGFADSTGTPSEVGLVRDAQAAWDYVIERSNNRADIILVGHSLGTGVVSGLAGKLASEGISPKAIVLIAPFASVRELLRLYRLFFVLPLLSPLKAFPKAQGGWYDDSAHSLDYLLNFFAYPFDSRTALQNVSCPVLIVNAKNDLSIPPIHSQILFNELNRRNETVQRKGDDWGTISTFGDVVWFEGQHGGHNRIGVTEGTIDLIADIAGL
ncbi:Alpha/Beta hydrolase protein [Kockovaella imperatae]|uniref:Alpha/Beta hydrolase protein n=1 Tax=Kockovaella imperatae TaxID=4999 RepID=A0A1Y1UTS8_9TREE|nr:Alpha/Beta hydrolase protein [Kockovaella imperatae]ORX40934.1 Alpha/Beta hydrolase protein [Kockovaella imperatae]